MELASALDEGWRISSQYDTDGEELFLDLSVDVPAACALGDPRFPALRVVVSTEGDASGVSVWLLPRHCGDDPQCRDAAQQYEIEEPWQARPAVLRAADAAATPALAALERMIVHVFSPSKLSGGLVPTAVFM
jgi:hypothetical protein